MAQAGLLLSDEGRTITAINDSTTTAITAGDPVYFTTNNDQITGTFADVRAAYAAADIKVKSITCSATGYTLPAGIALTDCAASSSTEDKVVTVALKGVFAHAVDADTEAGETLAFNAAVTQKLTPYRASATFGTTQYIVGRALTGGSADGKFIIWRLG